MREDSRDLARHGRGRLDQVWPDENLEMAIRGAKVIPTFADPIRPFAHRRKSDGDPQLRGQGRLERREHGFHALREAIEPRLAVLIIAD